MPRLAFQWEIDVLSGGGSEDKAFACNAGDLGSIPGLGRSPGEGNGNPLQYSYLENPMDRGAWRATVHGVAKNQTRLSDFPLEQKKTYFQFSGLKPPDLFLPILIPHSSPISTRKIILKWQATCRIIIMVPAFLQMT